MKIIKLSKEKYLCYSLLRFFIFILKEMRNLEFLGLLLVYKSFYLCLDM